MVLQSWFNMSKSSAAGRNTSEKASLTPADWERAALELIGDRGVESRRVEPLARQMGVTKGSFYWHFSSRDALLSQSLARWEQQDRQQLQQSLSSAEAPVERLKGFVWRTSRQTLTHAIYAALCSSPDHPSIRPVLQRVTRRRIRHLATALAELGLSDEEARHRANLMYSTYVGYLHLQAQGLLPDQDEQAYDDYVQHIIKTLIENCRE